MNEDFNFLGLSFLPPIFCQATSFMSEQHFSTFFVGRLKKCHILLADCVFTLTIHFILLAVDVYPYLIGCMNGRSQSN